MILFLWLACGSAPAPSVPSGPMVEPGTYSFWAGVVPGCVEPPEVQLVHLPTLTPIKRTVLNREGRYYNVDVRGIDGWIAAAHADDPRLLMMLSSDEPDAKCLQAQIEPLGEDRWLTHTASWISIINLTMSRVRHLAPQATDLSGCRASRGAVRCAGPSGTVGFDRDGVVMTGVYEPRWTLELQ